MLSMAGRRKLEVMDDLRTLIATHLQQPKIMQLATSVSDKPWICTVHFYADDDLNLYWVSRTDREHSEQIATNPKVAATVLVHENAPDEDYVIAVSLTGSAEVVEGVEGKIRAAYVAKHDKPDFLLPNPDDPNNTQRFYRITPEKFVLFDTLNFPKAPRQELDIKL
jgi:nitroimidazol reductase NimA-like FMN-containing flavoprotein (pyridoxamine 5'-phosphate oxidase superfamily)